MSLAKLKKKSEAEKPKGLAALKKQEDKTRPKGLAALAKSKSKVPKTTTKKLTGLAGLKQRQTKAMKLNAKQDFIRDGVKFHNCKFRGPGTMDPICYMGAPGAFWSVDVTNGNQTITCHNRWGAWLSGGVDKDGEFLPGHLEGVNGAKDLPAWVAAGCRDRYMEELKARKLPDINKLRAIREEEEKQRRKKAEEAERIAKAKEERKAKKDRERVVKSKGKAKGLAALKGKK